MDHTPSSVASEVPAATSAARVAGEVHKGGRDTLDDCHRNMALWTEYDDSALPPKLQKRFACLRDATSVYLAGGSMAEVVRIARVSERQYLRIFARCLKPDATGKILGCRGFVKGYSSGPPQRTKPLVPSPDGKGGFGGMFRKLLRDHAGIAKGLVTLLNAYGPKGLQPNRTTFRALHRGFLKFCTAEGIGPDEYPFTTRERAKRALRAWVDTDYLPQYASRFIALQHGPDAGGLAAYGEGHGQADLGKENAWVLDAHSIDLHAIYQIPNEQGDFEEVELRRFQHLRLALLNPSANLASRQVFAAQASSFDVSMVFWDALNGPPEVEHVVPDLKAEEGAGYPSCVIPRWRFAVPQVIYLDNALAHLADHVQHMATYLFGATVILGSPATPRERAAIEAKFSLLASRVVQQLPSTSGSGPKDPMKKRSAVPVRKRVRAEDLDEVLDVYARNENALPAAGSNNIAPLIRLVRKLETGALKPAYLPVDKRKPYFFGRPYTVVVRVDSAGGRRPYVNFLYVRYSSGALSKRFDLKGRKLLVRVDPRNLRTVMLFMDDGTEFGPIQALGHWGTFPHDVRIRRLFGKFKRDGELGPRADDGPLEALFAHLRKGAPRNPTAALQLTYLIRYLTRQDFEMGPVMTFEANAWTDMSAKALSFATLAISTSADVVDVEPKGVGTDRPVLAAPPIALQVSEHFEPRIAKPSPQAVQPVQAVVWALPRRSMRR